MALQFSPELVAGSGGIKAFRICKMSTTAFTGLPSTAAADFVVGVTDGSTRRFDTTDGQHANEGEPISLQPSNCVQIEAGGNITAGAAIKASTAGVGIATTTTGDVPLFVALEAAASGEIFWAYRLPSAKPLP